MSEHEDELYDAYLDACLEGTAQEPALFLRAHPDLGPEARERIQGLFDMARPSPGVGATTNGSAHSGVRTTGEVSIGDTDLPLEQAGEFLLIERLGAGGMGTVFLAEQPSLGRRVAIKLLHPDLRRSKTAVERFRREALALAKLRHPNVVEVYAVGEEQGQPYIAMELVEGRTLSDILANTDHLPRTDQILGWLRDIGGALQAAHEAGIVHRDVKPSNIRIAPDGRPLLLDFGIARDTESIDASLTRSFAGSPLYAAPEQITGAALDARADVYGLGVTLYECLTGRVPFAGGPFDQIVKRVLDEEPLSPRLLNPVVSRDLDVVCRKALEKEPAGRYSSAAAMADDLDAVLAHRPIQARPPTPIARLRKWGRRNPARATALVSMLAATLLLVGFLVLQRAAAQRQRKHDATQAVTTARDRLRSYREARERTNRLDEEIGRLHHEMTYRYIPPREMRTIDEAEDAVRVARREREAMFYGVLDALRQAEALDPDVDGVTEVRTSLYYEKWIEAQAARDDVGVSFYRERLAQFGADEKLEEHEGLRRRIQITSDPPGATVHLFRFVALSQVVPRGEHRLVAVPDRGEPAQDSAAWALRVVRGHGEVSMGAHVLAVAGHPIRQTWFVPADAGVLRRLDRLAAIDETSVEDLEPEDVVPMDDDRRTFRFARGEDRIPVNGATLHRLGVRLQSPQQVVEQGDVIATVWQDAARREMTLPLGLDVVTTALPLLLTKESVIGTTPLEIERPSAQYLFVLTLDGRVPVRFGTSAGDPIHVVLPPRDAVVPGCVYVPEYPQRAPPFWFMTHEVTSAEYLAFLNEPETLQAIAASADLIRVPRGPETFHSGGEWPRGADGQYMIAGDWKSDWPVIGVSYEDAMAYAAWKTRQAHAAGEEITYSLPDDLEWWAAGVGGTSRIYVFGERFRPKWTASCFGRRSALPRSVGSLPIDESIHGAFDMSGNASEWLDSWFDEPRKLRHTAGGTWARSQALLFKVTGGQGHTETFANGETGFRLVARRGGP